MNEQFTKMVSGFAAQLTQGGSSGPGTRNGNNAATLQESIGTQDSNRPFQNNLSS